MRGGFVFGRKNRPGDQEPGARGSADTALQVSGQLGTTLLKGVL